MKVEKKKQQQKQQAVRVVSCPECKVRAAVNKRKAYHAFHSKKHSKRRKALESAAQRRMPQVGKDTSIEYVLTDPSFAERVAPPKLLNEDDDFIPKIITWGVGIITFPVAIAYGFDFELYKIGWLIFALLIFYLYFKLGGRQLRESFIERRQYDRTWLCLKCGYQWVGTADGAPKS